HRTPKRAAVAVNEYPCGRAEHQQLGFAEVGWPPEEHATRTIRNRGFAGCKPRGRKGYLQLASLRRLLHVEHHEVHQHSAPPPVLVRDEELPEGWKSVRRIDRGEEDGPVTGDARSPQQVLRAAVLHQLRFRRPKRWVGEEQVACDVLE